MGDQELILLKKSDGHLNDDGIWIDGEESTVKPISADVQPFSKDLAYREYGYDKNVVYRAYIDYDDDVILGDKVRFEDSDYLIKKIIEWDNEFMELLLDGV
ncbi:hypothetical protein [Cytobacillus sp. IB215665]|uniref:hypothetical protein n=1 Tax=Cytobacillus sp. IB215665 TaxID=3097357 RepID=UPI002A0BBC1E|nr:hypothetical protein [Cytobacillus sp. IB215665]MDX8367855.1 hypothetical protein [Cytobacillus sp. IB215665]